MTEIPTVGASGLQADISEPRSWTTRNRDDRPIPLDLLRDLTRRSDARGLAQIGLHLTLLATTSTLISLVGGVWLLPAMLLQGMLLAACFAPMHESVHYTSFRSRRVAELVAWIAALPNLYNATHYRLFHKAHHQFTQDPVLDPELAGAKPSSLTGYAWRIIGLTFWRDRARFLILALRGRFLTMPYVPDAAKAGLRRSVALQLVLYAAVGTSAAAFESLAPLTYWILPAMLGRPFLSVMLLAEHTGCSNEPDGLANTRSTETWGAWRFILWNMPFHAEHHFYPSIPFHALPAAHTLMQGKLAHVAPGYLSTHRGFVRRLASGQAL
ncbi:MAG: fatty acid desaturase [Proteobacteria bacterium]|nr:fatty acid desaturase [Pseudomonadota bacterium]